MPTDRKLRKRLLLAPIRGFSHPLEEEFQREIWYATRKAYNQTGFRVKTWKPKGKRLKGQVNPWSYIHAFVESWGEDRPLAIERGFIGWMNRVRFKHRHPKARNPKPFTPYTQPDGEVYDQ